MGVRNPPPPCNPHLLDLASKLVNLENGIAYRIIPPPEGADETECLAAALGMYQVDVDKWFHTTLLAFSNGESVCIKRDSQLVQVLGLAVNTRPYKGGKWLSIGEHRAFGKIAGNITRANCEPPKELAIVEVIVKVAEIAQA